MLAYWSWAWLAPPAEPRAPAVVEIPAGTSAAAALFRTAKEGAGPAAASGSILLMGIVAASNSRSGHAVLRLDAKKTVAVPQGAEVEPGVRLAEVHADHIVLERNGARESLALPAKAAK